MELSAYQKIVYMVLDVVYMLSLVIFAYGVTNERPKRKTSIIIMSIVYMVLDTYIYFNFSQASIYIIFGLAMTVLFLLLFSREYVKNIIMAVFFILYSAVCETAAALLTVYFAGGSAEEVLGNNTAYTAINCVTRFLQLISALIYYNIRKKDKFSKKTPAYWGVVVFVFIGSLFIIETFYSIYYKYLPGEESYRLLLIVIVLMAINLLVFFLYEEQAKYFAVKGEVKQLINHVDRQKMFYENEKETWKRESIERHDMKNYFITLEKYIEDMQYDKLQKSVDEKISSLSVRRQMVDSGNKDIDIILNYKLTTAMEKGIKADVKFDITNTMNVAIEDMVVLLGNALDNAIEASEKTENPYISVEVICNKGTCDIVISNSTVEDVEITKDMEIKTTKTEQGHGWGIKSMKNIAFKYSGIIKISCEGHKFTLKISMFV